MWLELESAGSAWTRSARNSFCKTDPHNFCNRTTFLRVIPTMANINTCYININCHEYLKISETYSDILCDILSGILSGTLSGILSSILPGTLSGIGFLLTFFLAFFLAFYMALPFGFLSIWHSIWHSIRHSVWHSISRILSDILSGIRHCSLRLWSGGWGPAVPMAVEVPAPPVPSAIESWQRWRFRSALAVGFRQYPHVPTEIETWRLRSSRFQQCPHRLRAGSCFVTSCRLSQKYQLF